MMKSNCVVYLNCLSPAERKMFETGRFLALQNIVPAAEYNVPKYTIRYDVCRFKRISENEIEIGKYCTTGKSVSFVLIKKTVSSTFAKLDYNMLCAIMERCRELGWDTEE